MKKIKNIEIAKDIIKHHIIDLGCTDNILLFRRLNALPYVRKLGLMPQELKGLINKYVEIFLLEDGYIK